MTEAEANAEASKREKHKSKHMTHKRWAAVHNSVKGWHIALVDVRAAVEAPRVTMEGIAIACALFGPEVTAQTLVMLAKRKT